MTIKKRTILYRDGLVFIGIMAVIFLGAFIRQVNLLLLFASILACFLFFDFWFGRRILRGLTVRRGRIASSTAGEPFLVPLELVNAQKKGSVWGIIVEETITPDFNGETSAKKGVYRPACYFEEVKGGTAVKKTWAGKLPIRGRYRLGPVTISTRFPLGFFRSSVTFDLPGELIVYPKMGKISRNGLSRHRARNGERSPFESRMARIGDEMAGVRNWQSGDARKWIHWRASAKHQKILVRQFQNREDCAAVVLLDLYSASTDSATPAERENQELAVSFAATLWSAFTRQESKRPLFGLTAQDAGGEDRTELLNLSSSLPAETIFERLAMARSTPTDGIETLFRKILAVSDRDINVILVTPGPFDPETSDRLLELRREPRIRSILNRMIVIDSSASDFDDSFRLD